MTDKALVNYRSAPHNQPIPLSYLFRTLTYLKDSSVQTKQNTPKTKVTKCTHFYRKQKPLSCLFTFSNKNKNLYLSTM